MRHVEQVGGGSGHVFPDLTRLGLASAVVAHSSALKLFPERLESTASLLGTDNLAQATYLGVVKTTEDLTNTHNLFLVNQAAVRLRQNFVHDRVDLLLLCPILHSDILPSHT